MSSLPTVDIRPAESGRTALKLSSYSAVVVGLIRALPSARWDPEKGHWTVEQKHTEQALGALLGVPTKIDDSIRHAMLAESINRSPLAAAATALTEWDEMAYGPKVPSYEHQKIATSRAVRRRVFAFLMEMGTGKTKATIDTLSIQMQRGLIQTAVIFCPKAVVYNWEREWEKYSPLPADKRRVMVIAGSGYEKEAQLELAYNFQVQILITNYETLLRHERGLLQFIQDRKCGIVADESTRIKNHAAKQSKAAQRLSGLCPVRLILTGTPITQGPLDAFSQFLFLDANILGHHNYYSFKAEYAIVGGSGRASGKIVVGYRNLDRLAKRIEPFSMRVLKKDCLDIPEKSYRQIDLEMGTDQATCYRQMKEQSVVEFAGKTLVAPLVLTRMLRLQQISAGFMPTEDEFGNDTGNLQFADTPKIAACAEIVEECVANGQKVIVWCRFVAEIHAVMAALKGFGPVAYYGAVGDAERQQHVDNFQTDSKTNVFVGQIKTGGIGLNLTRATHVIYMTNPFSWEERAQSEDRAHRIGQRNVVTYTDLTCRGTIDGFVLKTLRDKKNVADVITGDNMREVLGI